jgi:ATP-binding cassette subfamily B protein
MISTSEKTVRRTSFKTLVWLLPFLWVRDAKIRFGVIASVFFTLLTIFFNTCIPLLFKNIINCFAVDITPDGAMIQILFISYGLAWTINQAGQQLSYMCVIPALERGMRTLNLRIFYHLHSLSMRFHLDKKTGSITNAIDRTQSGFDSIFWALFLFIIPTTIEMVIIIMVFASSYGFAYSGILFFTTLCYFLFCGFCMNILDTMQTAYNQKKSEASEVFVDSLLNIETVKYFHNGQHDYEKCDLILQQQEKAGIKLHFFSSFFQFGQKAIIGVGLIFLTYKSGNAVLAKTITVGDFVLINSYLLQFAAPLSGFGYIVRQVKKGLVDMGDIIALLEVKAEIKDASDAYAVNNNAADISFTGVHFGYTQEREILKDISFAIPAGKTVAIVGSTGSGKSTITKLLFRLYDVNDGAILFNNHDIRKVTQKSLHSAIGVVAQDTNLFNDTLYYNIAYARPTASQAEVEQAIADAHLAEFIARLPDGYNTIVGERGLKLSGGEKQRIAVARVLLKKPALYIFDEATSSLDNSTERALQKNLKQIAQGKTTLIIAHRLSTIVHADEIIVLDNGVIVEQGNHAQLLERGGMYYHLWHNQEGATS